MKVLKTVAKVILSILPIICIVVYSIAIVIVIISLNPSVTWNIYEDDQWGKKMYFSHTLWTHLDKSEVEGSKGGSETYLAMLVKKQIDDFKDPVIAGLYKSIGLVGGGALCLLIGISVHAVTKQKLFVVILKFISVGSGITGGYFTLSAKSLFKDGILGSVSAAAKGAYFFQEKIQMKLGYDLANYGAILSIGASALLLVSLGLYIPYGDGKWIWQKKTDVIPENKAWDETKKTPMDNVKTSNVKTNVVSLKDA